MSSYPIVLYPLSCHRAPARPTSIDAASRLRTLAALLEGDLGGAVSVLGATHRSYRVAFLYCLALVLPFISLRLASEIARRQGLCNGTTSGRLDSILGSTTTAIGFQRHFSAALTCLRHGFFVRFPPRWCRSIVGAVGACAALPPRRRSDVMPRKPVAAVLR